MTDQVILRHVTKRFATKTLGDIVAVDDFDFAVHEGECFSFLGPSGCGKSTTLRMIAGFEDLTEGEIELCGKLVSSKEKNLYIPPEEYLSSYELIQASKFIMVYNSTIGLEAAIMGAGVLCGGRSR